MGGYERRSAPWALRPRRPGRDRAGLQRDPARGGLGPLRGDRDQLAQARAGHGGRAGHAPHQRPEAFTPDNEFLLGESEVRGFFVAAGFCAHGLAGAGGLGKAMAEWIVGGEPAMDLWEMDIRRFGAHYRSPSYTLEAHARGLRDLLRHQVPRPRAPGRPPAAVSSAYGWHRDTARRSARSRAGSA
jgi:4-methylaminobutanoate oxidase (formaldehyde-forming)